MDIKKEFMDSNKGDIDVKLFVNANGEYVMCPYGRSPLKHWIGMAKLDYFITGNYKSDAKETIVKNILECINVGINYDKLSINRCSNKDDLVTKLMVEAKKNKFQNFHVISVDLSDMNEFIKVVEWERVGKSGNEWRGVPNTAKSLNYEEFIDSVFGVINDFIRPPMR